jgi:hypothetical protein
MSSSSTTSSDPRKTDLMRTLAVVVLSVGAG